MFAKALLFDLDGVLVDSAASISHVWERWASRHRLDAAETLQLGHGLRAQEHIALIAPHLDAVAEAAELERLALAEAFAVRACLGAPELLAQVPPEWMAIVTSSPRRVANERLRAARLPAPSIVISAEDVAASKPAPDGYVRAARLLGVTAHDVVVVEDSAAGVASARAAGMRVIAVTTSHFASELGNADHIVESLRLISVENDKNGLKIEFH